MTEPKKPVVGKQAGNAPSGTKQTTGSSQNKKPAAPKAQAKAAASKSPSKAAPSAPKEGSATADSARLKENAARAEALENRNILLPEENGTFTSGTEPTDVTGVIVPTDKEEMKVTKPASELLDDGKHKKKDKVKLLKTADDSAKSKIKDVGKPVKDKATLVEKTARAEKKVNKLKKKVQKAKKKEVKKSKLRLLKEKLIKAFSKWQRRKKKLDDTDK